MRVHGQKQQKDEKKPHILSLPLLLLIPQNTADGSEPSEATR
jgi:hypothetical protein